MKKLSVCVLTFNSERLLEACIEPLTRIADELIVVDSGSSDGTLAILEKFGLAPLYRPYSTHGSQMNFAIDHASHDWVLCMDSDEVIDEATVAAILKLKQELDDPTLAYRITRHWFVLGQEVHAIYPVSSPDYPVRLFNRSIARFNDAPVDDRPAGFADTRIIAGFVRHDTFYTIHEIFKKLNDYTTRLVKFKKVSPSLARAFASSIASFWKWYVVKQAWKDGRVGLVTATYASWYAYLKYMKAWFQARHKP